MIFDKNLVSTLRGIKITKLNLKFFNTRSDSIKIRNLRNCLNPQHWFGGYTNEQQGAPRLPSNFQIQIHGHWIRLGSV